MEVAQDYGRDPERLVRQAIAKRKAGEDAARRVRDDNLRYHHVWCVVDVDQHARLPAARRLAQENGIGLAVSNPCFELWALLHFHDQRAHIDGRAVRGALCTFLPGYEKRLDCIAMEPHRPVAVERARALDNEHERNGTPHDNPSTGVWRLTEAIEAEARRFRDQGSTGG